MPEQLSFAFPASRLAEAKLIKRESIAAVDAAFQKLALPEPWQEALVDHIFKGNLHSEHLAAHSLLRSARKDAKTRHALSDIARALFKSHAYWTNASLRFPASEGGRKFREASKKALEQAEVHLAQVARALPRSRVHSELRGLIKEDYLPYYLFALGIHARNLPEATEFGEGKKFGPTRTAFALAQVFRKARADGLFSRFNARTAKWIEGKIKRA
ncbi:MAG: hypothetical protein AB1626_01345 [Candidatus Micrarchaeota archaeon]